MNSTEQETLERVRAAIVAALPEGATIAGNLIIQLPAQVDRIDAVITFSDPKPLTPDPVAAEREACAKEAADYARLLDPDDDSEAINAALTIAANIRARGAR